MTSFLEVLVQLLVGLVPVLVFLLVLVTLDSFKLVPVGTVLSLVGAGAAIAVVSLATNRALAVGLELDGEVVTRYVAPVVEEGLKGVAIVLLLVRRRIGFLVDAAIAGFAVGAGFAALENLYYLGALDRPRLAVWIVRGFGTAIMHGGVTATFAVLSRVRADRRSVEAVGTYLPGWLLAVGIHSAFNHFILAPDLSTLVVLVVLPLVFFQIYRLSEERTREWLGTGFDTDAELLKIVTSGRVTESRIGSYVESLAERFAPTTVADMICLLRLRLELSIRAKGILILREAGIEPQPDPELGEKFAELEFLERSVGPTGLAALKPILHFSDQDLWQYHLLARGR